MRREYNYNSINKLSTLRTTKFDTKEWRQHLASSSATDWGMMILKKYDEVERCK